MLDEEFAEIAAMGAEAVVTAAGTPHWPVVSDMLASWFGDGDQGRAEATHRRLHETAAQLAAPAPRKLAATWREQARATWRIRIRDHLDDLPVAAAAEAALLLHEQLRDIPFTEGELLGWALGQEPLPDLAEPHVAAPQKPLTRLRTTWRESLTEMLWAAQEAAEPVPAVAAEASAEARPPHAEAAAPLAPALAHPAEPNVHGDIRIEARDGSLAFGQAQTVNYYQASAPAARVPLPHRIGRVPAPAAYFQERHVPDLGLGGPPLVLTGTPGTGKTQLAARLAQTAWEQGDVRLLLWVDASSRAGIAAAYARAAQDIYGQSYADPADGALAFLNWLQPAGGTTPDPWLIVLDGVTDPADLDGDDPLWPPASPVGRVVLTSHRRDFPKAHEPYVLPIRGFTRDEVRAYMDRGLEARGLGPVGDAELDRLIDVVGEAPRFLAVAVERIAADDITLGVYLDRVESAEYEPFRHTSRWQSVLAAHNVSSPGMGISVLQLVAVLGGEHVPEHVLHHALALDLIENLAPANSGDTSAQVTERTVLTALKDLHGMSLLERERRGAYKTVRMDPPLRRAVLAAVPTALEESLVTGAAAALLAAWPQHEPGAEEAQLLRQAATAVLTAATDFDQPDDDIPPLVFRAGAGAGAWGRFAEAERIFREALRRIAPPSEAGFRNYLSALACAARWRGARGDDSGAMAELTEVLTVQRRALADDHPDVLATRHYLAWCELCWYGWDMQAPRDELAFVLREQTRLRPEHTATLETLFSLVHALVEREEPVVSGADSAAVAQRLLGHDDVSPAEQFATADLVAALAAECERVAGPAAPLTLAARGLLAVMHLRGGDVAAARQTAQSALADAQRALGPAHPATLDLRTVTAFVDHGADDSDSASATLVNALAQVLAEEQRTFGAEHPYTLETRWYMLKEIGETEGLLDAAQLTVECADLLADMQRVFGADHARTRQLLLRVSDVQANTGHHVASVITLADLLVRSTRVLGADHPTTLLVQHDLGLERGHAGDAVGAVVELSANLSERTRVLGADHPDTRDTRLTLAWFRGRAGDVAGAIVEYERLIEELERVGAETDAVRRGLEHWKGKATPDAAATS
ncbi:tetratricopeptide repeat protein [Actinacidiphila epipremni]|uniref:Tetratricopeptide repeat protein n=1 Tax=Actinacidiphila epipremni TaxID=2053013 RepID=A0ABX0ZMA6_9ACTN|nr:tetratricopeptide repeat protein [Actinacidiphila epipremni]NJP43374.1 tetratricopeptide repeat protein [Actinacidiphila epipremni]